MSDSHDGRVKAVRFGFKRTRPSCTRFLRWKDPNRLAAQVQQTYVAQQHITQVLKELFEQRQMDALTIQSHDIRIKQILQHFQIMEDMASTVQYMQSHISSLSQQLQQTNNQLQQMSWTNHNLHTEIGFIKFSLLNSPQHTQTIPISHSSNSTHLPQPMQWENSFMQHNPAVSVNVLPTILMISGVLDCKMEGHWEDLLYVSVFNNPLFPPTFKFHIYHDLESSFLQLRAVLNKDQLNHLFKFNWSEHLTCFHQSANLFKWSLGDSTSNNNLTFPDVSAAATAVPHKLLLAGFKAQPKIDFLANAIVALLPQPMDISKIKVLYDDNNSFCSPSR